MEIKIKKLTETAKLPTRGSNQAAGYDLYADLGQGTESVAIDRSNYKVHTGIAVAIPEGYFGAIYARSGLATKKGLRPANCVGIIDSDYRGEIIVCLKNDMSTLNYVENGERIAQLVIQPYLEVEFNEVDELPETERGEGGFGSTGKK